MAQFLPTALMIGGSAISFMGQMQQASAVKEAGKAAQTEAEYRAAQARVIAGQERAASQRTALEKERRGKLAMGTLAVQAGAGGVAGDTTLTNIMADLLKETRYTRDVALYEGEDKARNLESQADLASFEGQNAMRAAKIESRAIKMKAIGTLLGDFASKGLKYDTAGSSLSSEELLAYPGKRRY